MRRVVSQHTVFKEKVMTTMYLVATTKGEHLVSSDLETALLVTKERPEEGCEYVVFKFDMRFVSDFRFDEKAGAVWHLRKVPPLEEEKANESNSQVWQGRYLRLMGDDVFHLGDVGYHLREKR